MLTTMINEIKDFRRGEIIEYDRDTITATQTTAGCYIEDASISRTAEDQAE